MSNLKIKLLNKDGKYHYEYFASLSDIQTHIDEKNYMIYNDERIVSITDMSLEPHFGFLLSNIFKGNMVASDILIFITNLEDMILKFMNLLISFTKKFFIVIKLVINSSNKSPFGKLKFSIFSSIFNTQIKSIIKEFGEINKDENSQSIDEEMGISKNRFNESVRDLNKKYNLNHNRG